MTIEERAKQAAEAQGYYAGASASTVAHDYIVAEDFYKQGAEDQRKMDMEKVSEWVFQHVGEYIHFFNCSGGASFDNKQFKEHLKQVIQD